jgi:DNA-binding FadR family transcriptional regulator
MQDAEFGKLERLPAYRLVYDAIEGQILSGRLRVGDPLPPEIQLAGQFGVNRSTHFLDLASSASRALILHSVTFRELWDASMIVEPAIAEKAARDISEEMLAEATANIAEMDATVSAIESGAPADVDAFVRLDRDFHEILADAAGNRVLALAHEPVTSLFIPAGRIILPRLKTYRRVLDAHRYIYKCLAAHDAPGAMTWMRKHMDDFRRAYELTGLSLDASLDAVTLGVIAGSSPAAHPRRHTPGRAKQG